MVSGGARDGGIRIASTEIYSDNAWRVAGALPRTMWGMSAATINNRFLLFGNVASCHKNEILNHRWKGWLRSEQYIGV